jgi:hypothetical protein
MLKEIYRFEKKQKKISTKHMLKKTGVEVKKNEKKAFIPDS